jgi:hypothetical protein
MAHKLRHGRCCCGCVIATNNFQSNLDNMTGTGTIAGGVLTLDAGEQEVFNEAAASEADGQHLLTYAATEDATAAVRLKLARVDDDTYLFGEFGVDAGEGTIRLGQRSGGSDIYLTDAETISDTGSHLTAAHELLLCWQPGDEQPPDTLSFVTPVDAILSSTGWMDPDNMLLFDGSVALYDLGAASVSNQLIVSFKPPPVPPGATLDGFVVALHGSSAGASPVTATCQFSIDPYSSDDRGPVDMTVLGPYVFGADDDPWDFGGTAVQFNGATSVTAMFVFFNDDPMNPAQLAADFIGLVVYGTTAGREQGLLQFRIRNNGTGQYQCISSRAAYSTGLQAGLRSETGTWDFTEATFSYLDSEEHPQCPDCCEVPPDCDSNACDEDNQPPGEMVVNAGSWSLSAGTRNCNGCTAFGGDYIVSTSMSASQSDFATHCQWKYVNEIAGDCSGQDYKEAVVLALIDNQDGTHKWTVLIQFASDNERLRQVTYESDDIDNGPCMAMPVTLTKILDIQTGTPPDVCPGTSPGTITIDVP